MKLYFKNHRLANRYFRRFYPSMYRSRVAALSRGRHDRMVGLDEYQLGDSGPRFLVQTDHTDANVPNSYSVRFIPLT